MVFVILLLLISSFVLYRVFSPKPLEIRDYYQEGTAPKNNIVEMTPDSWAIQVSKIEDLTGRPVAMWLPQASSSRIGRGGIPNNCCGDIYRDVDSDHV